MKDIPPTIGQVCTPTVQKTSLIVVGSVSCSRHFLPFHWRLELVDECVLDIVYSLQETGQD